MKTTAFRGDRCDRIEPDRGPACADAEEDRRHQQDDGVLSRISGSILLFAHAA